MSDRSNTWPDFSLLTPSSDSQGPSLVGPGGCGDIVGKAPAPTPGRVNIQSLEVSSQGKQLVANPKLLHVKIT